MKNVLPSDQNSLSLASREPITATHFRLKNKKRTGERIKTKGNNHSSGAEISGLLIFSFICLLLAIELPPLM